MNTKRKAICLAVILFLIVIMGSIAAVCHIASSFNEKDFVSSNEENVFNVRITGAVRNEGLYRVKKNTLLYDCIRMAGGIKDNADLSGTDLLKEVDRDCDIFIPKLRKGDIKVKRLIEFSSDGAYMKCNINSADEIFLTSLSGIGSKTASNIVRYRQEKGFFKSKEELLNVNGIGVKTYNKIKDCITVGGEHK